MSDASPRISFRDMLMQSSSMSAAEGISADTFARNVQFEFPDGKEGILVFTIAPMVIQTLAEAWKKSIIIKLLGMPVSFSFLERHLMEMWRPVGKLVIIDLLSGYSMVRFKVDQNCPWKILGRCLMVRRWDANFNPTKDGIKSICTWIQLLNLTVPLIGRPLKVDKNTLYGGLYARVCVELDLTRALVGGVMVNGDFIQIKYEGLSEICLECRRYRHLMSKCALVAEKEGLVTAQPCESVGRMGDEAGTSESLQSATGNLPEMTTLGDIDERPTMLSHRRLRKDLSEDSGEVGTRDQDKASSMGETNGIDSQKAHSKGKAPLEFQPRTNVTFLGPAEEMTSMSQSKKNREKKKAIKKYRLKEGPSFVRPITRARTMRVRRPRLNQKYYTPQLLPTTHQG
ncbi:hypothetical protein V2J09_016126 [Rumex salicifolius]